jgi:hypothetical protein
LGMYSLVPSSGLAPVRCPDEPTMGSTSHPAAAKRPAHGAASGRPTDRPRAPVATDGTLLRSHHARRRGTNPKIVSEVLGHKEVAITLDRYSHALPTLQARAMARLDTLLGRAPRRRSAHGTDAADAGGSPRDKGPDRGPDRRGLLPTAVRPDQLRWPLGSRRRKPARYSGCTARDTPADSAACLSVSRAAELGLP